MVMTPHGARIHYKITGYYDVSVPEGYTPESLFNGDVNYGDDPRTNIEEFMKEGIQNGDHLVVDFDGFEVLNEEGTPSGERVRSSTINDANSEL